MSSPTHEIEEKIRSETKNKKHINIPTFFSLEAEGKLAIY